MKKLLTILLISVSLGCIGQEDSSLIINDTRTIYFGPDSKIMWNLSTYESVKIHPDNKFTVKDVEILTVGLLLKYADECYQDSTRHHTHDTDWRDRCYAQAGNLATGYYWELICKDSTHYSWLHKEPTFTGFIKWLKK